MHLYTKMYKKTNESHNKNIINIDLTFEHMENEEFEFDFN